MNTYEDLIEELKEEDLLGETVIETGRAENTVKAELAPAKQPAEVSADDIQPQQTPAVDESDLRRQKAMDEVAFLQIVEHVFAGVEREQLKIVPKPYDDLKVQKVLHNFLQFSLGADSDGRSKAEFQLLQEIESWHWSLAQRDERVTAAHLRRYCETSRPPLSSPALVALARFYRNSLYSEAVRNKFDLVVTRLFSKANSKNQRELVFSREELVTHLTELYAEWSSVSLYSTEADDAKILEIAHKFESYAEYADDAVDFNDLIKSDFFTRLHLFKESTSENFYAPLITATGIESNVRIGNRYVELLEADKQKGKVAGLENRYGIAHDNAISEATAKTYSLIELLKEKNPALHVEEKNEHEAGKGKVKPSVKAISTENGASKPNKWLIAATILAILITAGIYFATKSSPVETRNAASKSGTNSENAAFKEYLTEARVENGMLVGSVSPTWNQLTEEKRKDALQQMLSFGSEKGYKKVQLENKAGKTVGSATSGNVQLSD